jgi:ubiquinone/menaquinone biosynthesis C-methylase UbiE
MKKLIGNTIWLCALAVIVIAAPAVSQERPRPFRGDPKALEPLDRDSWQMPEEVMDLIGVRPGMVVGELGAGGGYFTVKLARRVGESGHVYANDINSRFLRYIDDRCRKGGITNVTTILGEAVDPKLPAGVLDMAVMVNVLHEVAEPVAFLRAIRPGLKPGAALVIIDYDYRKRRSSHTYNPDQAIREAGEAGYEPVWLEESLARQFILVLRPAQG